VEQANVDAASAAAMSNDDLDTGFSLGAGQGRWRNGSLFQTSGTRRCRTAK
jgi:hypothetical protein